MLKDVEIFIALVFLLVSILCIYNARWIVKNKLKSDHENTAVVVVKSLGYILCVTALIFIYYIGKGGN